MEFGIRIQVLGEDEGLLRIAVDVSSRGFRGSTQAYTTADAIEMLASDLHLFPQCARQTLEFKTGEIDGYFYFGLTVSVLDAARHCACRVEIESNVSSLDGLWSKNRIDVDMGVEPNALDRFVAELRYLAKSLQGEAILAGVNKV